MCYNVKKRFAVKNDFQLKHIGQLSAYKTRTTPRVSDIMEIGHIKLEDKILIMEKLGIELGDMPEEVKCRTFEGCSVRLYNALRRRGILTIGDLCAYTPQEIFSTKNFGYKCLLELYRFILLAVGKEVEKSYVPPKLSPQEIVYEAAYKDYLTYRNEYEEHYAFLIQCILHIADAKLKDREKTVTFARFGIFEKPKTLQEIGSGMGLTRERIRQIYMKSKRKMLSAQLPTSLHGEVFDFAQHIARFPAGGFLAFLCLEGGGMDLAEFVCTRFFRQELYREELSTQIKNGVREETRTAAIVLKREKFNSAIEKLIVYPTQKTAVGSFF